MNSAGLVRARLLESWEHFQRELVRVVTPLSEAQLRLRVAPNRRSLGEIAEHIVRARALWLPRALGTDPTELEPLRHWDDDGDPPRSAAEIVDGLVATWRHLRACVDRWPSADADEALPDAEVDQLRTVWGLLEHDLQHAGQLSFVLGSYGLDTIDA